MKYLILPLIGAGIGYLVDPTVTAAIWGAVIAWGVGLALVAVVLALGLFIAAKHG